jgi:hypothetical protein
LDVLDLCSSSLFPCGGLTGGVFPVPPALEFPPNAPAPPPPDPPGAPAIRILLPPPPPDVIVENIEGFPFVPEVP